MDKVFIIYFISTILTNVNPQTIIYANRMRNFSIESETNSGYVINFKIFQDELDHKLETSVNITKDIHIKNIEVLVNRCMYEKSACENFQRWKFTEDLKSVVYMHNQMWTPLFEYLTPKLDIPRVKKNIYYTANASFNTKAILQFYPEVINYFWRADAILNDYRDKKALTLKFEFAVHAFVIGNRKRDRGGIKKGI